MCIIRSTLQILLLCFLFFTSKSRRWSAFVNGAHTNAICIEDQYFGKRVQVSKACFVFLRGREMVEIIKEDLPQLLFAKAAESLIEQRAKNIFDLIY